MRAVPGHGRLPRRLAAPLTLAMLAGCAVGPRYHAPRTPAGAAGGFVSSKPTAASSQPLPAGWWRLYQDPVLDRLVPEALVANQDLRAAAANLAYADAVLSEAKAGRFPTTDLNASAQYNRSATLAAQRNAQWTFFGGFAAAYQLDLFGRIRKTVEAARASADAQQAAENAVRVTVAAGTAGAYAQACGLGQQIAVARRSVAVLQQTYDLTVTQRNAGALADLDVHRQGTLLEEARAAIAPLEGQRRAALFTLAALLGRTPDKVPPEAEACVHPPTLQTPLPVGDGATLLRRRPDVRQAERQLAAAVARIGVATADFFPTVSLGGSVSTTSTALGQVFGASGLSYSVGPLITWTFPNFLVASAHVREARAQAQAQVANFDRAVLTALKEAETALSAYAAELDHHQALAAAAAHAEAALGLAQIQYDAGAASFLDLLLAQSSAVTAEAALAASEQAVSSDQIAVFQALGGGWEQAPPVVPPPLPKG